MDFPEEIRKALLQNASELMPITVGWSSHTICSMTIEEFAKEAQIDCHFADFAINTRRRYCVSWQDGKYLEHREDEQPASKYTFPAVASVHEFSFDGENIFGASRHEADEPWRVIRSNLAVKAGQDIEATYIGSDFLEYSGFIMPGRIMDLLQKSPVRSKVLQVLGDGGELTDFDEVELGGRMVSRFRIVSDNLIRRAAEKVDLEKARIELDRTLESEESKVAHIEAIKSERQLPEKCVNVFYLDPLFNYAIRRFEWNYEKSNWVRTIDCEDLQPVPGRQIHLPKRCLARGTIKTDILEMTKISVDPLPAERFSLKDICGIPGTSIHEGFLGLDQIP